MRGVYRWLARWGAPVAKVVRRVLPWFRRLLPLALAVVVGGCMAEEPWQHPAYQPPGLVSDVGRSTLYVSVPGARCSAVVMEDGDTMATAWHCLRSVENWSDVRVVDSDGVPGAALDCWRPRPDWDVGYCTIDTTYQPVQGGYRRTHSELQIGERIYTLGYGCDDRRVTLHLGTAIMEWGGKWSAWTDPPVCPGDSGGPAIDAYGRVFGIVTQMPEEGGSGYRLP